jgi:hypothetical protein
MSFLNQPPLTPGFGNYNGMMAGNHAQTKNPFYSVGNQFLPRNLHDVIRWVRFITIQSPVTTEVLRKLSTYPITKFVYDVKDPAVKDKYEKIERSFKLKTVLHDIGFQYHTIGNVFISVHFPIHRSYRCPNCKTLTSAHEATFLKFKNYKLEGTCNNPTCGQKGIFDHVDTKSKNIEDMNVIIWDPLNISVNNNPITGKNQYFYTIPNDIKRRVVQGDRFLIDSLPWEFIDAIKDSKQFQFESDRIFHLRNVDMGFSINGISVPPLVSHFSLVFYQATLRKANESIATDFMAPMRVIFPQPQTSNSDPVVSLSMRNFTNKMEEAFIKHKQDNNHVIIAPVPVGYQAISGEGKTLLVNQEIAQAEESLLLSMGVSRELLSGTTNWTSSTVGLRMLKNTLDSYVGQIEDLIEWIFSKSATYLDLEVHGVHLTPFQLTDDDVLKNLVATLASSGSISMTTVYESMGRSYEEELERMLQEAKVKARHDVRLQFEVEQSQYLEGLEINKETEKDDSYMEVLKQCQDIAAQLIPADEGTTRAVLNELKVQDYAKYLMVAKLVEEGRTQQTMATSQELGAQAQDPNSPNAPKGPNGQPAPGGGSGGAKPPGDTPPKGQV